MSFIGSYNPHLLDGVQHVHFIGCGGSGTYPLIQILHSRGLTISGSDVEETKITKAERAMGVTVYLEHDAAHLGDALYYSTGRGQWQHCRQKSRNKFGTTAELWQYRIILSADTASEVRQLPSQKRR